MAEKRVDRAFAEKFLQSVDAPLDYGVYFLFHEWWEEAPESAIDGYVEEMMAIPNAEAFLAERHFAEPLTLERLAACAPGTLGHAYRAFIVENSLEQNLGRNYRAMNEELTQNGKLKRLPADLSYMIVRGFQVHDFMHILTGYRATHMGELALAAYYLAQMRFPYHAMRMAVTAAHYALLEPRIITECMDAIADGWSFGRRSENINFAKWEDEIDTPLLDLRQRFKLDTIATAV